MLLLHTCCTDCVLKLIDALKNAYSIEDRDIHLFYYNPNIHPESEYLARLKALQTVAKEAQYKVVVPNWRPSEYFDRLKNIDVNNKQLRCPQCWMLRLSKSIEYAAQHGYTHFSSTLLSSTYMDSEAIIRIAKNLTHKNNLELIIPQNINHCLKTAGFYKQNFCGCVYSLKERLHEKFL